MPRRGGQGRGELWALGAAQVRPWPCGGAPDSMSLCCIFLACSVGVLEVLMSQAYCRSSMTYYLPRPRAVLCLVGIDSLSVFA